MFEVKYAISLLGHPSPCVSGFVSQLSHEFAGKKEVLSYTDLNNALKWDTEEKANQILKELPDWAKNKHKVVKIEPYTFGWCYANERI